MKKAIERIHIDRGLISSLNEVIQQHGSNGFLIVDDNIVKLLNRYIFDKLDYYIISGNSVASQELVNLICKKSQQSNFLIAVGSGTVSDLCKYAGYITNKSYILFPTAASMNGYTSLNASIKTKDGRKRSFMVRPPEAIYIDIDVIVNAPQRMTNSGFADFMCRSTVQADWLLSHLLLGSEYQETPFLMIREAEQALIDEHLGLVKKDELSIMILMQALILSGLGMMIVGGSHSASQGEHMISHCMEMLNYSTNLLHGETIGVTTLSMARLQEKILSSFPSINTTIVKEEDIVACFGIQYVEEFMSILNSKKIDLIKARDLNQVTWSNIADKIRNKCISARLLEKLLYNIGAPYNIHHVGWSNDVYMKVSNLAFITRNRFTFLDLAHFMGVQIP